MFNKANTELLSSYKNTVNIYYTSENGISKELKAHKNIVTYTVFSNNEEVIASVDSKGAIIVWSHHCY